MLFGMNNDALFEKYVNTFFQQLVSGHATFGEKLQLQTGKCWRSILLVYARNVSVGRIMTYLSWSATKKGANQQKHENTTTKG